MSTNDTENDNPSSPDRIIIGANGRGMIPSLMILIYSGINHFIEVADIDENMNITASKPMSIDTLKKLHQYISKNILTIKYYSFKEEIFPKEVLYTDLYSNVVWYVKPARKAIILANNKKEEINFPGMVFQVKNGKFYAYIIKDKDITGKTQLFGGIFPNSYGDGSVCIGSNKRIEFDSITKFIKYYTELFFEAKFTAEFNPSIWRFFKIAKTNKFPISFFKNRNPNCMLEDIL